MTFSILFTSRSPLATSISFIIDGIRSIAHPETRSIEVNAGRRYRARNPERLQEFVSMAEVPNDQLMTCLALLRNL